VEVLRVTESEFTRAWSRRCEDLGAMVIALVGSQMQQVGLPDRYVCHRRFRGWVEVKRDGGQLRAIQRINLEKIIARGDTATLVRLVTSGPIVQVGFPRVTAEVTLSEFLRDPLQVLADSTRNGPG
jgi:hypothetical protein